jgi:hypothetical protein
MSNGVLLRQGIMEDLFVQQEHNENAVFVGFKLPSSNFQTMGNQIRYFYSRNKIKKGHCNLRVYCSTTGTGLVTEVKVSNWFVQIDTRLTVHVEFRGRFAVVSAVHRRVKLRGGGTVRNGRPRTGTPPPVDLPHCGQLAVRGMEVVVAVPVPVGGPVLVDRVENDVRRSPGESFPLPDRLFVYPAVHGDHHHSRDPEADGAADQGVVLVDDELAHVGVLLPEDDVVVGGVPAQENGREADQRRQQPHVGQHEGDRLVRHGDGVLQRSDYGVVPVDADAAQVEDRRRGEVHVEGVPHVAHERPEEPLPPGHLDAGVESHRAQSHQHVGHRQADDVVVGDHSQLPVAVDADYHQSVAQDGTHDYRSENEPFQDEHQQLGPVLVGVAYGGHVRLVGGAILDQAREVGRCCR